MMSTYFMLFLAPIAALLGDSFDCKDQKTIPINIYITQDVIRGFSRLGRTVAQAKRVVTTIVEHKTRKYLEGLNAQLSVRRVIMREDAAVLEKTAADKIEAIDWNMAGLTGGGLPLINLRPHEIGTWFVFYQQTELALNEGSSNLATLGTPYAVVAIGWKFSADGSLRAGAYLDYVTELVVHEFGHLLGFAHDDTEENIMFYRATGAPPSKGFCRTTPLYTLSGKLLTGDEAASMACATIAAV